MRREEGVRIIISLIAIFLLCGDCFAQVYLEREFEFIKELKKKGEKRLSFGKEMESEFFFDEGLTFLNHGSFGATPRSILYQEFDYQIAMEHDTMRWMNHKRIPLLNETRTKVAQYISADPEVPFSLPPFFPSIIILFSYSTSLNKIY